MILRVILVVVLLIAAILIYAATKPNTFQIERSQTIDAPAEKIFPLINDFHNWPQWAPQDREDSTLRRTFSGVGSGVGAVSAWAGSGNSGSGNMEITESIPNQKVIVQVDFTRPFQAHNINEFILAPSGNATRVTWKMHGTNVYMMKVMSVFLNMDHMMGQHFESGLDNLKAAAEK
jgi:uncharacterized protein YndB with AHSA1/START domain